MNVINFLGGNVYQPLQNCLSNDKIVMTLMSGFDFVMMISCGIIGYTLLRHFDKISTLVSTQSIKLYGVFFTVLAFRRAVVMTTMFAGTYRAELVVNAAMFGISTVIAMYTIRCVAKGRG